MRAFGSDIIQADDELDHIGLYIKHNVYTQYAKEMLSDSKAEVIFHGYHSDVDTFFTEKLHNPEASSPLKQEMPSRLTEIINTLSKGKKAGRVKISSYLLDCGGSWRRNIANGIDVMLARQKKQEEPQPLSAHGNIKLTIFCWQKPKLLRKQKLAIDHARATMLITGEKERLLLELLYDENGNLEDVDWSDVSLTDISKSGMKHLMGIAETLKNKRLAMAGKVGRNAPCPCGSGKKYKKCCRK